MVRIRKFGNILITLVESYENKHYPMLPPDPIEAIKLKMTEKGLKNKDFIGKIGTKGYISSILNKKKPLTFELAKWFHNELGISAEVLLS